jgi:hypothetical protein
VFVTRSHNINNKRIQLLVCLMVFNATFNNISFTSWRSALLMEETEEPGESHRSINITNSFIICHFYPFKKFKIYMSSLNSICINLDWVCWVDGRLWHTKHELLSYYTCNEHRSNRAHLNQFLYTNCRNRPCGNELNSTAFANLHIYSVYVKHYPGKKFNYRLDFETGSDGMVFFVYVFHFLHSKI